jgi:uncharacterized membrane protein YjjP (DUF1212 family)
MEHRDPAVAFVVTIGRALHRYGAPAHRLEDALSRVAKRLGLEAHFFVTPTGLFASFDEGGRQQTILTRVEPGEVDLERMVLLNELVIRVVAGKVTPTEAVARVEEVEATPPRYGRALTCVCFGLVSATTARIVGGGIREIAVAGFIGLAVGLWATGVGLRPAAARIFEPLAGAFATVVALAASAYMPPVSVYLTTLAGLIILLPGLTLTVAVSELATRNLVSGAARLVGALLIFLMLGFGVIVGGGIGTRLPGARFNEMPVALPGWTEAVALAVTPFVLAVIFKARPRDVGWVAAGAACSFGGARLGTLLLGPEFGVCVGALLLGVGSNLAARWRDRPSAVLTVPGLMLIVPGSVGFGSVSSFLNENVVTGVEAGFHMSMIVVSLVTGLLLAGAIVPPRRAL